MDGSMKVEKRQIFALIFCACAFSGLTAAYPAEVFNQLYGGLGINETLYIGWGLPPADKPDYLTPIELNKSHVYCVIVGDLGVGNQTTNKSYDQTMVGRPSIFDVEPVSLSVENSSAVYIVPVDLDGNRADGVTISTNHSTRYHILVFRGVI
jgi:hypothetical protein